MTLSASGRAKYTDRGSLWDSLTDGSVALVRGTWLVEQSLKTVQPLPRRQDLPPEATWDPHELIGRFENPPPGEQAPNLVVVGGCWWAHDHPDPSGHQMRMLGKVLAWSHSCPCRSRETAVFVDWLSLHQPPLTAEEAEALHRAMKFHTSVWHAHVRTDVLVMSHVPTDAEVNEPYSLRGWAWLESSLVALTASFRPEGAGVYDLGRLEASQLEAPCTAESWRGMQQACTKRPGPPLTLDMFVRTLEERAFTHPELELGICKDRFAQVFTDVMPAGTELSFQGLEWGDDEVEQLVPVLHHCSSLMVLNLRNNCIGDRGVQSLTQALPPTLRTLVLRGNQIGDAGVEELAKGLSSGCCPNLMTLSLSGNNFSDAGLAVLSEAIVACSGLHSLHLGQNSFGDAGVLRLAAALERCRHVQQLDLEGSTLQADTVDALRWVWLKGGKMQEKLLLASRLQGPEMTLMPESPGHGAGQRALRMHTAVATVHEAAKSSTSTSTSSPSGHKAFCVAMLHGLNHRVAAKHVLARLADNMDVESQVEAVKGVQLLASSPEALEHLAHSRCLVPRLIKLLQALYTPLRAAAAGALHSLVSSSVELRKSAVKEGAVAILLQQLSSEHTELLENSSTALWSLSSGGAHAEFLRAGAVQPLAELLRSKPSVLTRAAVGTLANLAGDAAEYAAMVSNGVVGELVGLLRERKYEQEKEDLRGQALLALQRLVESNRDQDGLGLEESFLEANAFPVLVPALQSHWPMQQEAAARILRGLTRHDLSSRRAALSQGLLRSDALPSLLDLTSLDVQRVALDVLWNVTGNAAAMIQILSGKPQRLVPALRFREPEVRLEVARVLQSVLENVDRRDEAVGLGAVQSTVDMLGSVRGDMQLAAAGLLRTLSLHPDAKLQANSSGAVPILAHLLGSKNVQLQDASARALRNLATDCEVKVTAGKSGTIPALAGLLLSSSPEVQEAAAGALRNLFYRNGDNKQTGAEVKCLPRLVGLLRSPFLAVQLQAVSAIVNFVSESSDIEMMKYLRHEATDSNAVHELEELLSHEEPRVRQQAETALACISPSARVTYCLPSTASTSPWKTTRTRKAGACGGSPLDRRTVHEPRLRSQLCHLPDL